jgi:hypothetical protein
MKTGIGVAAAIMFMPSVASAASFVETQPQTGDGQNFVFSFTEAPTPIGDGALTFRIKGDFTINASLGESFSFSVEDIHTGTGIQATASNLITSFGTNDNLFEVSYVLTLAQLSALTADNVININVDYADGVDAILSASPSITTTLDYASSSTGAVPEPATWAMMLLGFGFVGGAIRSSKRRQKVTASYA